MNRAPLGIARAPCSGPTRGAAAALAERLERFCATSITIRERGSCAEPGVSDRRHRRLGHDVGCATLGVPRRAIQFTLSMWDGTGAAALLMEAIDEAIAALGGLPRAGQEGAWNATLARECVAYAIRIRITPRP